MSGASRFVRFVGHALNGLEVSNSSGRLLGTASGYHLALEWLMHTRVQRARLLTIGNGGSASIAEHVAIDFQNKVGIPCSSLREAATLTCLANDYGFEHVYSAQIEKTARRNDTLVAISSSGESQNILNAVAEARRKGLTTLTLSGFSPRNPLRFSGQLNFYIPSTSYGTVEVAHLALCHSLVDNLELG